MLFSDSRNPNPEASTGPRALPHTIRRALRAASWVCLASALACLFQCWTGGMNYSRTLFEHIPDDPELLVLVQPNELAEFTQKAVAEMDLANLVGQEWDVQMDEIQRYHNLSIEIFEALGIPWSQVRSAGVLIYFQKPIFLACGEIDAEEVRKTLLDLGFTQNRSGSFNYVYEKQKLLLPEDGLIMMAEEDLLEFLMDVPEENRLWNREDFKDYRLTSPLDNTIFVWSQPPESFLQSFAYKEELGAISLAVNLEGAISIKNAIRLHDPQKTVILYDLLSGGVSISRAAFANDPVYGSLFRGIEVSQDNNQVITSLVIPAEQVTQVKNQLIKDLRNPNPRTFDSLQGFFKTFR